MKKIICSIFSLFLLIEVGAQSDYRVGYIITNEQDTIYGWIDYRGDIRNAKTCSFKEAMTDQTIDYFPSDIAAYRYIDSKFYISKNIGGIDAPKQVFLEYLVNGLAKLYYYRDTDMNDYYYIEKDDQLYELKKDEREVLIDGTTKIRSTKSYVGVLKATLNVWEMNNEIDKANLEHSSLINIVKNYHDYVCTDGSECIIYEKKKSVKMLRFAPVVGVDISTIKLMNAFTEKYRFNPSSNLTVGVNLNISIPQIDEKIFLQIQALYTKYYFFDTYEIPQSWTDIHILSNVLQIGFSFKYEYPKGKLRPTFAAGPAGIYLSDATIEIDKDIYGYSLNEVRAAYEVRNFPTKFMYGFEIIPGVHYYLNKERILFIQLQYMKCFSREFPNAPNNTIQSFGISTGIYF